MAWALVTAPVDDEPTSPEEDLSAAQAWSEYQSGLGRPWEEARRELFGE